MSDETTEPVDRVKLDFRVDREVKEAFEKAVFDKHRGERPYWGITLERELQFRLDGSGLNELWESVDDLADEFGHRTRKEKIPQPSREETTVVQYRVREDVREDIKQLAEETRYDSTGEFVESIMWRYANGRGSEERLADRADRILQSAQADRELSAKERRTRSITEALRQAGGDAFDLKEFDDAVDTAARGIDSGRYARKVYLPRVLDELGYEWHPKGFFADPEEIEIPDQRDPAEKPYFLLSEADKRLAVKYAGLVEAQSRPTSRARLDVSDVKDALDGKPNADTARAIMQDVADAPGFVFDTDETTLKVDAEIAAGATDANADALARLGWNDDGGTADDDAKGGVQASETTMQDGDTEIDERPEWATEAAEQIPEPIRDDPPTAVVDNKIARVKWPDEIEDGEVTQDGLDRVTDEHRRLVREALADQATDEPDPEAEAEAEMNQLMSATPANARAATDGGHQVDGD